MHTHKRQYNATFVTGNRKANSPSSTHFLSFIDTVLTYFIWILAFICPNVHSNCCDMHENISYSISRHMTHDVIATACSTRTAVRKFDSSVKWNSFSLFFHTEISILFRLWCCEFSLLHYMTYIHLFMWRYFIHLNICENVLRDEEKMRKKEINNEYWQPSVYDAWNIKEAFWNSIFFSIFKTKLKMHDFIKKKFHS